MKKNEKIAASYDDATDVLYVIVRGRVENTRNHEEDDGLLLRYEAGTDRPAGATLVDFKEHWLPRQANVTRRLSKFFGVKQSDVAEVFVHAGQLGNPRNRPTRSRGMR